MKLADEDEYGITHVSAVPLLNAGVMAGSRVNDALVIT